MPPVPVDGEEELPELESDCASSLLILSKPMRAFIFFAAFCAACPTLSVLLARLDAESDAFSRPVPASSAAPATAATPLLSEPLDLFPVINFVKDLNAFASVTSFPITILITRMIGVNKLIRPCPIVAMRDCICRLSILHWFAQLPEVRAKSPCAADSLSCTNW